MPDTYAAKLQSYLPGNCLELIQEISTVGGDSGYNLYLVGGIVRDMFLERANLDLDLVVEGDAIRLAQELAHIKQVKLTSHPNFGTATLKMNNLTIDLAAARRETYKKPGALPTVRPGATISDDLFRRDFTINAMAINLNHAHFGELVDPFNGLGDLADRVIRILHTSSFKDDPTRIFRAIRYGQRLGFSLEGKTCNLLKRNVAMLNTISGNRIRHELELILKEDHPEMAISLADDLGVLGMLHPALQGNGRLAEKFTLARRIYPRNVPYQVYLCLFVYNLGKIELEQFTKTFSFPKTVALAMSHTLELKVNLRLLSNAGIKASEIFQLLDSYTTYAIEANMLATASPVIKQNLQSYLSRLRHIKTFLDGGDLKKLGVHQGPAIGELLSRLHRAKLDGEVSTKIEEEQLVSRWVNLL